MIDLDELQSVRDTERRTDKLQQLRDSFYADAGEYIRQLRRERERAAERADDPFDAPEVARLSDEIDTAEGTVEAIFERRIGKIVKAASLAAADQPVDAEGLTTEEQALFDDLVGDIVASRERVLATLDGETGAEPASGSDSPAGPVDTDHAAEPADGSNEPEGEIAAADLMGAEDGREKGSTDARDSGKGGAAARSPSAEPGADPAGRPDGEAAPDRRSDPDASQEDPVDGGESETPVGDGGAVSRATVHVTTDVGVILGVDGREYDLAAEDVLELPTENAEPLIERGAAERLD